MGDGGGLRGTDRIDMHVLWALISIRWLMSFVENCLSGPPPSHYQALNVADFQNMTSNL